MDTSKLNELERTKIQMEFTVPLVRHLQNAFGSDEVIRALKNWTRKKTEAARAADAPAANFEALKSSLEEYLDLGFEQAVVEDTEDQYSFNMTRCPFMEMMEEMGARDLGPHLICNHDFPEALEEGFRLQRTQTIMKGYDHCNFKYTRR